MKKKKIIIKYFIITSIIMIGILPMINVCLYAITYDLKKLFNTDYDFKKLFHTDTVEMYINYRFYKVYNKSLIPESVIIGKDGFLFLGNKYSQILDKTQGVYKYHDKDIDKWTNKLQNIQTYYEERGIKFAIVIAPNKHSVYKEKLPNWMNYNGRTITDDIVSYSKKKNINLLDLRKILQEKKATQLYFTTDTHWNNQGSAIGFENTIKYINNIYKAKYKIPNYELLTTHEESGDLASFLKINSILPKNHETNYAYKFENESDVCHGNISEKHIIEKCNNKKNPQMFINSQAQYMINKYSLNKDKLLLLCDSFATANSKLYNETFNTIWKFYYEHINGNRLSDFVTKHKPDIVIYQVVERNLYNAGIVKKLANISVID